MQMKKLILAIISALALCNLYANNTNKNREIVENMLQKAFYDSGHASLEFNWKKIFNAIDKYKLNPLILKDKNGNSLLTIAIRMNRSAFGEGGESYKKLEKECFDAVKILLEKYHLFKEKPCGGDDCNKLIALALESDSWAMSEGYSDLAIVDLLLKHGAKPNQKTINNIKKAYDSEGTLYKGGLPHIKALLKR